VQRTAAVQQQLAEDFSGWAHYRQLFDCILEALPDARFVGDSTQTVYSGNHLVELDGARRWFNSSTGYGTLGYGLPAAVGAKLAEPARPVISLMGDGGIQFSLPELASAVEAKVGVIVLLWNNSGYGEIKRYMERRDITPLGVDIYTPDLLAIARGFGCEAERARDHQHLQELLRNAPQDRPLIIEVLEQAPFHP
jgi:acetolactate synthase-1/2/3 large subunit